VLSACRDGEVGGARWSEFNLAKAEWTISPKRFKSESAHVVPLTAAMLALLEGMPRFRSGNFIFSVKYGRAATEIDNRTKARLDWRMRRTLKAPARARRRGRADVEPQPWWPRDLC